MAMFTQPLSVSNGTEKGLRDPSFSSYLTGAERSFVLNMVKQCKATDDGDEIGVFSADRYFNEGLDVEKPKVCEKPVARMVLPYVDNPIQPTQSTHESRAMSVRSSSSGNSQAALLQRAVRHQSLNGGSKVRGRGGFLGSFRCRCVCSDRNSVAVEEYERRESRTSRDGAAKESMKKGISPVTAVILGVYDQGPKRETHLISKDLSIEDLPRKSLEVFGLPVLERRNKPSLPTFETEKKLRLNGEEEHQIPAETVIPTMAHGVYAESDSDASSDLFEIEDFSTGTVNPFLSRRVSRDMSGSATPTAGYAPSEASIAWSVLTASAADFPITSDQEELRSCKNTTNSKTGSTMMNKKVTAAGDKSRRLSNSFLACKSQHSVTVIDHAHITYEKISDQKVLRSQDLESQVLKPQTEAMLTGFEPGRNMQVGIGSRSAGDKLIESTMFESQDWQNILWSNSKGYKNLKP